MSEVRELRNVERRRHARFELDPGELVALDRRARARGEAIVGVWHSHPDREARPSARDRSAACRSWTQLIVAVRGGIPEEITAWRLEGEHFRALGIRSEGLAGPMCGNREAGPSGPAQAGRP